METPLIDKTSEFLLPVDSECKALLFRPWRIRGVHMRAFHASWMSMFVSFFSTFAPAALSVTIRDSLDLTDRDISYADISSVAGTILSRILLGSVCDAFGPRVAHAALMLLTSLGVFAFAIIQSPFGNTISAAMSFNLFVCMSGYILCRLVVGLSLGTFVACQYWSSVMFNVGIVGRANAFGAGAGASGGGITQMAMPLIFSLITISAQPFLAWRLALLIPGILHILISLRILTSTQDLPDGSFTELYKKGTMRKSSVSRSWWVAIRNHRLWLCTLSYAFSFGVELTIDNIATTYFFDNFAVNVQVAGLLGCSFGALNIIARPVAGILSDMVSKTFGMRGRLTLLLFFQVSGALFLIFLSLAYKSLFLTCIAMVLCALGTEGSQAALFAIVPFVSKRSLGVVNGIVGAGGNVGATLITFLFFNANRFETKDGLFWTGISFLIGCTNVLLVHFPMWGGILTSSTPGVSEVDYYLGEYTAEEIMNGEANRSLKFATESRSQRGGTRSQHSHSISSR